MKTSETIDKLHFDELIEEHLFRYYWESLGLHDWKSRIKARKEEVTRFQYIIKILQEILNIDLTGKKILDLGCGWGGFVVASRISNILAFGCDVDKDVAKIAVVRSKINNVSHPYTIAPGELLPFHDDTFDFLYCDSVLEHVQNVSKTVREIIRVLKKGGSAFIQAPNYQQPIERHYKIFFPPKCPKSICKLYLKVMGRPEKFLDTINFIDYKMIKNEFEKNNVTIFDIENTFRIKMSEYKTVTVSDAEKNIMKKISYIRIMTKLSNCITPHLVRFFEKHLNIRQIYFHVIK